MTLAETAGVRLELLLGVFVVGNVMRALLCFCLCAHGVWPWALIHSCLCVLACVCSELILGLEKTESPLLGCWVRSHLLKHCLIIYTL